MISQTGGPPDVVDEPAPAVELDNLRGVNPRNVPRSMLFFPNNAFVSFSMSISYGITGAAAPTDTAPMKIKHDSMAMFNFILFFLSLCVVCACDGYFYLRWAMGKGKRKANASFGLHSCAAYICDMCIYGIKVGEEK